MPRIAHLSDVHLLAPARGGAAYRLRTRAVRFGRSLDPARRAAKLTAALDAAVASGAEHLVISGDLTELGDDAEFELFADVLSGAGLSPESVTLVPGNHDAYTSRDGFRRALAGPLSRWAETSARPGELKVIDRGAVAFVPLDVSRYQSVVWSGGELTRALAEALDARLSDRGLASKAVVVVIHHPPFPKHAHPAYRIVDSLRGGERLVAIMDRHPHLHLMHGHFHRMVDRPRIFGAPGVADDGDAPRLRVYEVREGGLVESLGLFGDPRAGEVVSRVSSCHR